MANFAAEFPIDTRRTVQEVARLACQWIAGSPHSAFEDSPFDRFPSNGEQAARAGTELVRMAHATTADGEIGGIRYEHADDMLAWTTSIVALKTAARHVLRIEVGCQALTTLARLPPPKKPYFIKQALAELGGGNDGEIPVTDKPFRLAAGEEAVAASLILGTAGNALPIVYVSAGFAGQHEVDPDGLARLLGGLAHVVVEPDRSFAFNLRGPAQSRNVFGGTIGVYWPHSDKRSIYFRSDDDAEDRDLAADIARDIRIALSNRRERSSCTWVHLKEVVAQRRYEQLKAEGSTELDEFVAAFDADLAAKQQQIEERDEEIARLHGELRRLSKQEISAQGALIRRGQEQDLYEHEIRDIVITALRDAVERMAHPDSRREHVLKDLIAANPPGGLAERMCSDLKVLLRDYRSMDAKLRSALDRMGFRLSDDGRHWKTVFHDDPRYTITFPKTGSDHRGGLNMVRDITNELF